MLLHNAENRRKHIYNTNINNTKSAKTIIRYNICSHGIIAWNCKPHKWNSLEVLTSKGFNLCNSPNHLWTIGLYLCYVTQYIEVCAHLSGTRCDGLSPTAWTASKSILWSTLCFDSIITSSWRIWLNMPSGLKQQLEWIIRGTKKDHERPTCVWLQGGITWKNSAPFLSMNLISKAVTPFR